MRFTKVHLAAFGYELAPVVVTTEELEERLEPVLEQLRVPRGYLERITGIVERRWWEPGFPIRLGATRAAIKALRASTVPASSIGMLVYGGVCREHHEPATACHVAAGLAQAGLAIDPYATVLDISNACLGVLEGIVAIAHRIELGQIRAGLVVACESARSINEHTLARLLERATWEDWTRSIATFTGGSGAAAVLVSDRSFEPSLGRRIVGGASGCSPAQHELCIWGLESMGGDALREFASTDSSAVLEHGIQLGERTWGSLLGTLDWQANDFDRTVCHQVGRAHREAMMRTLHRPLEHDFAVFESLGNTGSVALPLAAALAEEREFIAPGHRVGLLGIASGLNCLMLGVAW